MSQSKGEVSKKNEYNHYDDDQARCQANHCVGDLHQQSSIGKARFFWQISYRDFILFNS